MTKICFLTVGNITWASSRYRSFQPVKYLDGSTTITWKKGSHVPVSGYDAYVWMKTGDHEAMKLQRENGGHVIVEVCDPNWWFQPRETRRIIDEATCLVAATEPAAQDLKEWYGGDIPIYIIPDRVELEHFPYKRTHRPTENVRFIWYGIASNRMAMFAAHSYLERLAADGIKFSLTVCDDRPEERWGMGKHIPVYQIDWSLDKENEIIASHDIALLPPYPGPWGKLKTNNKTLTAWACGLPVTDAQDYESLYKLATRSAIREAEAEAGYQTLIKDYRMEQTSNQWLDVIDIECKRRDLCTE